MLAQNIFSPLRNSSDHDKYSPVAVLRSVRSTTGFLLPSEWSPRNRSLQQRILRFCELIFPSDKNILFVLLMFLIQKTELIELQLGLLYKIHHRSKIGAVIFFDSVIYFQLTGRLRTCPDQLGPGRSPLLSQNKFLLPFHHSSTSSKYQFCNEHPS